MKIVIIEDEAPAFRRLQKVLEEIDSTIEIVEVIDSVEESIKWFNNHTMPDLIFMEIQLSDGLSFEIFESVQIKKPVIFTTAYDEYSLRAFKVNSIDYLLKPIKKNDLEQSLIKYNGIKNSYAENPSNLNALISQIKLDEKNYKSRFLIKMGDKLISILSENISLFYVHNGLVYLKTMQDKKYIVNYTLDELAQQLDPTVFYRANRQNIIQFQAIQTVHKWHKGKLLVEINVLVDEKIIISAEKATDFKKWLGDD